jgi:hypothetical protein
LNSSLKNIQFQKTKHLKWISGSEVMNILKSTNFQKFSGNNRVVCKVSSKLHMDINIYNNIKWICAKISLMHLLHHIHIDIYIFNKIFTEHKLAHLQGLLGVKDIVAKKFSFVPSSFLMHCTLSWGGRGGGGGGWWGVSHKVFPFFSIFLLFHS